MPQLVQVEIARTGACQGMTTSCREAADTAGLNHCHFSDGKKSAVAATLATLENDCYFSDGERPAVTATSATLESDCHFSDGKRPAVTATSATERSQQ